MSEPMSEKPTEDEEPQRRLRLYARRDASGEVHGTFLIRQGSVVALWEESGVGEEVALPLPPGALEGVFRRYGKPLEPGVTPTPLARPDDDDEPLVVPLHDGGQARLRRFQFMPYGWVYPADYLLWEYPWPPRPDAKKFAGNLAAAADVDDLEDAADEEEVGPGTRAGGEPLAVPAPLVVSALSALCRAAAG